MGAVDETESPQTAAEPAAGSARRTRSAPELARGTSVGRYIVIEQLGAGGMGVVYSAFDPELGRKVALKLVTSGDQERMLREAQALARLAHANVVAIYDAGEHDGRVFLAMELVDGVTLSAWRKERRSWREIVAMFAAAGRGLAAAHAAGIIHRDFKPVNVLVGRDGRARVLDFGLARAAGELPEPVASASSRDVLGADLTATGSVLGTPVYMPPEAFAGEIVGAAGDQFSFCVGLYEALYGERPFDRPWTDLADPPPLRPAPAGTKVPAWLRKVIVRGLAATPGERFASMNALLAALEADPAKAWRAAARALTIAIAIGGSAAAVWLWRAHGADHSGDPCAVSAPFAGSWDPITRARVQLAFARAGGAASASDFDHAAAALDENTAHWLDARTQVCAQRRGSDPALLLQLACFDQQKEELASLVELFEQADAATVKQAARAAHQLQGPHACANARSLTLVDPPTEAQRPAVAELRKDLARIIALRYAGKAPQALPAMPALVAKARAIGYRPVIAEALLAYARVKTGVDDWTTDDLLDECERIALATRIDTLAARCTALRLWVTSVRGNDPKTVSMLEARARTLMEREHDPEAERLYNEGRASMLVDAGDFEGSAAAWRRALELATQLYGPDSLQAIDELSGLAFTLMLSSHYDEAITVSEDVAKRYEAAIGDDGDQLGSILDNEGMALAIVGRYAEALAMLDRAAHMHTVSPILAAAIGCDASRALLGQGKVAEAIASSEHGIAKLRAQGYAGVSLANNMDPLAAAYLAAHRFGDALATANDCLAVFRKQRTKDQVDEVGCLAVQGTALVELGKPRDAVAVLEATLALQAAAPAAPGVVANLKYQLARALVASHGDRPRATQLADQAHAELVKLAFKKPLLDELDAWRATALARQ